MERDASAARCAAWCRCRPWRCPVRRLVKVQAVALPGALLVQVQAVALPGALLVQVQAVALPGALPVLVLGAASTRSASAARIDARRAVGAGAGPPALPGALHGAGAGRGAARCAAGAGAGRGGAGSVRRAASKKSVSNYAPFFVTFVPFRRKKSAKGAKFGTSAQKAAASRMRARPLLSPKPGLSALNKKRGFQGV